MPFSDKPMRVNLFKLQTGKDSEPLDDLLTIIGVMNLDQRAKTIGHSVLRLETIEAPGAKTPYWLLDFCKLRYSEGPGRASPKAPTTSFDLDVDEGFAEETAMLFDPVSNAVVIQYNHHGPRSGVIASYLSTIDPQQPNQYDLLVRLNPSAQVRLKTKKTFTRLQVKVAPSALSDHYKKANVSVISSLEKTQQQYGSDYVELIVSLDARSPASLKLSQWIKSFKDMALQEPDAVSTLRISGRDDADSPVDTVDLMSERLEYEFTDIEIDDGRRLTWASRRAAMIRSYNGWKKDGLI